MIKKSILSAKFFLTVVIVSLSLGSCLKVDKCPYLENNNVATANEIANIQTFLTNNNITNAIQHSSGVFYVVNNAGTGATTSSLCSSIYINYSIYNISSSTAFDSNNTTSGVAFTLGNLIDGVKKIVPLIKAGGSVTIFIPPSLGYGSQELKDGNGNVILPADSYLKFEMNLLTVQ